MKVAVINDTHRGIRKSSDIFMDNSREFFQKVFFPYCEKYGITRILHLGDYFDDQKSVNIKALDRDREDFLNELESRDMHMDLILGNHDIYFVNTTRVNSPELILHSPNITIHTEPTILEYDGFRVGVVPWITTENYEKSMDFMNGCTAPWLAGHFAFEGFTMLPGVVSKKGMSPSVVKRFDKVLSGHFHTKSAQGNIEYLGSQLEFTWADAHDPKYFHVIDTEQETLEAIRNPFPVFRKIMYNDEKTDYSDFDYSPYENKYVQIVVINKTNQAMFESFVDSLEDANTHRLTIYEDYSGFAQEDMADSDLSVADTKNIIQDYVESVQTDLDKSVLSDRMIHIYHEAQVAEVET